MTGDHLTQWTTEAAAKDFGEFTTELWWRLGYEFLPPQLEHSLSGDSSPRTLLDLGCGHGTITRWLARRHDAAAIGVDSSAAMIRVARRTPMPGVRFLHRPGENTGLPASSVDAAVAAFVLVCVPDLPAVRRVCSELARVVRPGGHVAILDSHPETTGVDFGDVVQGEPGRRYADGDPLPVWLRRRTGSWAPITDTYWSTNTYTAQLTEAGFDDVCCLAPTLPDIPEDAVTTQQRHLWRAAAHQPPFLLIRARRRPTG